MKIIILNFEIAEVHVYPFDDSKYEDGEEFFEDCNAETGTNFSNSNCQWMIAEDIEIQIH